jgi:glycosyltransferase involved in cell wall biosynthesis
MGVVVSALRHLGCQLGRRLCFPFPLRRLHYRGPSYANTADPRLAPGVTVVGFARAELGLGQHLRNAVQGLDAAAVPLTVVDSDRTLHPRTNTALEVRIGTAAPHRATLLCLNFDGVLHLWHERRELFRERYVIAWGYWELSELPPAWLPAMNVVDEVWAPSRHIQQMVSAVASVPVVLMPPAVEVTAPGTTTRAELGLPEGRFTFLFSFDFSSTLGRKNPQAVVAAFARAFPRERDDIALVLKVKTNEAVAGQVRDRASLLAAIDDPRVTVLDRALDRGAMLDLLAQADAYVSLHRAEGFGLGLAEAMALGTPVVATAWSGNTDFTTPDTALLVPCTLVPAPPGAGFGLEGSSLWAEPDVAAAAAHLRRLADDPAFARALGERGRATIRADFSAAAVGHRYRRRLELLGLLS